jgi:hypothetical protein
VDYRSEALHPPERTFDRPHGRVGYGMSGSFSSGGEYASRSDAIGPAAHAGGFGNEHAGDRPQPAPQRRGPKNYRRSDERIHEDVCERLMHDPHLDVRDVTVEDADGHVTLIGTVPHKQMKRWIEDAAAECAGVADVENKLRVPLTAAWPEPTLSFDDARASGLHEPPI